MSNQTITQHYALAGDLMRQVARMLTGAPDGLLKTEIESAAGVETASPYIYRIKKWGVPLQYEWITCYSLTHQRKERLRLYRLTPGGIVALTQAITKVHAVGL